MAIARSKVTMQGQISVPANIRRRLGAGPGSTLEWVEKGGDIVVRRTGKYTIDDIHRRLFPEGPPKARTLDELKEGIRKYVRKRYGRD